MGSNSTSGHYSFLHIEDNPLDAELTAGRLRAAGFQFDMRVADCRASFEEALHERTYDLILADYSLPDFDGHSAMRMIRERDSRVPIIFISGVLGEDVAVETLLSGATDYVLKQKMDRLLPAVSRALAEYNEFRSRQRAESEVAKVEARFKKLTNSLPSMVWASDLQGRLTFTNSLWDRGIGRASTWFDPAILHPSDRESCLAAWHEAQSLKLPFELDCRYQMANGDYRWHLVWGAPFEGDYGEIIGWVGTCTDTEQQRHRDTVSRTAEKLALTGRMASVIAHEINNPLEAMTILLYLLRPEISTETGRGLLSHAEHELLRISAITKLTLRWSREEGTVARLAVKPLVEETIHLFFGKLRNKHIHVHTELDPELEISAVGGEIRQVLANLISNAIDAVRVGGNITLIGCETSHDGHTWAELTVQDDGPGIAAERITEIFAPFHTTKGDRGNGLGLFISKEIVDRHKGLVLVDSKVGVGTRVRILLPALEAAASGQARYSA